MGTLIRRPFPAVEKINAHARAAKWFRDQSDLPNFPERSALYSYIRSRCIGSEPIDFLEFGVYRGATIEEWTSLNVNPDSRFYGFDSFEGLPDKWERAEAGLFSTRGEVPKVNDPRVKFVKGWFNETLPEFLSTFLPKSRLVIHYDADVYSSTLYVLTELDKISIPETIVIFDEFRSPLDEFRAFHDYLSAYRRKLLVLATTKDGRAAFIFA